MTKEEIFKKCLESKNGAILQEKNFSKNFPDIYNEVISYNNDDLPFIQKLYNFFHDYKTIPLTECGKTKKFRNFRYGYNDFCEHNCSCFIQHRNAKSEETSMKKYGVKNPMMLKEKREQLSKKVLSFSDRKKSEIADKKRKTIKENYGDAYGNIIAERMLRTLGVSNPSQNKNIYEKIRKTQIEKYGGIGFASEELRNKGKETNKKKHGSMNYANKEKRIETCLKKYGTEYSCQAESVKEKIKNACIEKYGVDNASKSDIVKQKISEKLMAQRNTKTMKQHEDVLEVKDSTFIVKCDKSCDCGGEFEIPKHLYFQRLKYGTTLCTVKNPICNKAELETTLLDYVKTIYQGEIIIHNRKLLSGKEIDIFLPELNIGFEFNGDYWHANPIFSFYNDESDYIGKHSEKWNYDMNKEYEANTLGISIYTVWEFFWKTYNEETKLWIADIIKNQKQNVSAYYKLKTFLNSFDCSYEENLFGIFEFDNIIVRYANGYYCGKNTIDKNWFIKNDKRVIYVYDFEVNDDIKFSIIKSLIRHALGLTKNKIHARKCDLREITNKEAKPFLNENSLFGHRNAEITIGLFYENELVMVYSFGHNFYGKGKHIEVIRVCTKKDTIVNGGSSKCLNYFIRKYENEVIEHGLVFYVDKIHQDGNSLKNFKFIRHEFGVINYWNIDYEDSEMKGERFTAFNRMPSKHKKIKELEKTNIITCILTAGVDVYEYDK